jgi:hypothetical protein
VQTHPERNGHPEPQRHGSLAIPLEREAASRIAQDILKGLEAPETDSILIYLEGDDPAVTEWMVKLDKALHERGHDFLSPVEVEEVGPPPMPASMYIGPIVTVAIGLSAEEIATQFHDVLEEEMRQAHESEERGSALDRESDNEETGSQGTLPLEG